MPLFDSFREAMAAANAPTEASDIARLLELSAESACGVMKLGKADIRAGGPTVMLLLAPGHAWEAVIVGPDAYQLYPGFSRDDGKTIVWANVWVAANYSRERFISLLEDAFLKAAAPAS